jgi:hypothetical protein
VALGLHANWTVTEEWLNPNISIFFPPPATVPKLKKKCPEIPTLTSYSLPPPQEFWEIFPSNPLPSHPVSKINFICLKNLAEPLFPQMTTDQVDRVLRTVHELEYGSTAPLISDLPGIRIQNSRSVVIHGEEFTDILASWVKKGYVAGPFPAPPVQHFRSNAMLAIEQKGKIRIVMDLSSPKGASFNDAVDEIKLEKISMSTARKFGYSVVDCGVDARMWKWDFQDAYKNIPSPPDSFRFQGFRWLGMNWVETQKVFGDKEAVSAFDRLGRSIADMACIASGLPSNLVHRVLDDTPVVTPNSWNEGPDFAAAYEAICHDVGAVLAPPCPAHEKSFADSNWGTVLGISFDTRSMMWSISKEKSARVLRRIQGPLSGGLLTLLDTQKLLGTLNDIGQMCPFLSGFRHALQQFLIDFGEDDISQRPLPLQARKDLRVWAAGAAAASRGLPIPHRPTPPSLACIIFVSDAAGAQFIKQGDRFIPYCTDKTRGAASISPSADGSIWFCSRIFWPRFFLLKARDSLDHAYGCKSSTLEAIGILLPLLCCPSKIAGREILLLTDNESVVFGWDSCRVQHDVSASIILRSVHIISHFLGCQTTVQHLPRKSTPLASLADELTRSSTTKRYQLDAIRYSTSLPVPKELMDWLHSPSEDWDLPLRLLDCVKLRV